MYALQPLSSSSSTSFFFSSSALRADKSSGLRRPLAPMRKIKDSGEDLEDRLVMKTSVLNLFSHESNVVV